MKIARVIVDVPSAATDQSYDYKIPEKFKAIIKPGMRVIIPFGPRKITGFVVALTNQASVMKLREIVGIVDMTPVLTEELIILGKWLVNETLCLHVAAYQAMLPQLLKMTYDKELVRCDQTIPLPNDLANLFEQRKAVSFQEIEAENISYSQIQQAITKHAVKINYIVQSRKTKKFVTYIKPLFSKANIAEAIAKLSKRARRQREIVKFLQDYPEGIEQTELIDTLGVSRQSIQALKDKRLIEMIEKEVYRSPYDIRDFKQTKPLRLTHEQQTAIKPINRAIHANKHDVFLLHGVTGSGKTEIYLQAIAQVLEKGKEAIVLVPEIALTPQMVKRFKGRFGEQVAVLHSALSAGEKYDEWRKIQRQEVKVVVGARSAIFAPFTNLGIIIIDEEHEYTYKQEEQPRYHARDVAIWRGKYHNCPVVLGSATPALESYARAQKNVYQLLTLTKRTNKQPMPQVNIVDMRQEIHRGNRTMFSQQLTDAIYDRIEKNEQIVLFLNRRGYSTFIMCRDCGHVNECPHCDIALTYHKGSKQLKCHYCNYIEHVPNICPMCESELIRYFGTGTEKVEEALKQHIPEVSILRMDVDTTRRKGAHERILNKFSNKKADILLGTQMIAKGLDFKNVTLVGVLIADSLLHLPDFRSAEKTFQLLTQVSGRAGRHTLPGEVIVQTYTPDHYSIKRASEYNFLTFYETEMTYRRTFQYPPYVYLVLITVTHPNVQQAVFITQKIVQQLVNDVSQQTTILGPSPSPITRIKNRYRYQCMIKYKREPNLGNIITKAIEPYQEVVNKENGTIVVDMQPYQLM
ncbi:MAG TPA: primosomal protein N' [Bacillota bacterium]|nr:primosomal protein N' [Bacillota bacterium]